MTTSNQKKTCETCIRYKSCRRTGLSSFSSDTILCGRLYSSSSFVVVILPGSQSPKGIVSW